MKNKLLFLVILLILCLGLTSCHLITKPPKPPVIPASQLSAEQKITEWSRTHRQYIKKVLNENEMFYGVSYDKYRVYGHNFGKPGNAPIPDIQQVSGFSTPVLSKQRNALYMIYYGQGRDLARFDKYGRFNSFETPGNYINTFDISPDEKYMVYTNLKQMNGPLYRMNLKTKQVTTLTSDTIDAQYPVYSPDGQSIAFISNKKVCVLHLRTGDIDTLTHDTVRYFLPKWSPDGKWILYSGRHLSSHKYGIYKINLKNREIQVLTSDLDGFPMYSFSKNGKEIVYSFAINFELWKMDADGNHKKRDPFALSPAILPCW